MKFSWQTTNEPYKLNVSSEMQKGYWKTIWMYVLTRHIHIKARVGFWSRGIFFVECSLLITFPCRITNFNTVIVLELKGETLTMWKYSISLRKHLYWDARRLEFNKCVDITFSWRLCRKSRWTEWLEIKWNTLSELVPFYVEEGLENFFLSIWHYHLPQ